MWQTNEIIKTPAAKANLSGDTKVTFIRCATEKKKKKSILCTKLIQQDDSILVAWN